MSTAFLTKYTNGNENLAVEYKRFLQLKFISSDFMADKLSPSPLIDEVWHKHLLDTLAYDKMCTIDYGAKLHHNPDHANDPQKDFRYQSTLELYKSVYHCAPPIQYWPASKAVQVKVKTIQTKPPAQVQNTKLSSSPRKRKRVEDASSDIVLVKLIYNGIPTTYKIGKNEQISYLKEGIQKNMNHISKAFKLTHINTGTVYRDTDRITLLGNEKEIEIRLTTNLAF